jgi:hypothetical protein
MSASMNVRWVEAARLLYRARQARVIWLRKDFGDQLGIGHLVDDPWHKVARQAVRRGHVDHEVWWREGAVHHTTTSRAAGDVESVLLGGGDYAEAIATKACAGLEYLRVKGAGGCGVLGFGVERPVPVAMCGLARSI